MQVTAAPERARRERGHARASLSVVCMTAGPGPRVAAILGLLRPIANEIIVALDDRADDSVLADVATVSDRVIVYPFAPPVDRPLPWLFRECRSDWMLTIDDDEVPSVALLDVLPNLCADDRIVHYSLARRWVYPDTTTYLDDAPWRPDYQLRLFRTDPRLIRFSDALHRPIIPKGPGAFVREPIWHLDTVLRTHEQRLAKAHEYEVARPGLRAAGQALNYAFYVPEGRASVPLAPLPAEDRALLDAVLAGGRTHGEPVAVIDHVGREEIDAQWPERLGAQDGTLEILEEPRTMTAGEQHAVDVVVRNTGSATWQWGRDAEPAVRCASWWDAEDRTTAIWTPLPAPVAPGASAVVPVHVRAPSDPGTHVLHVGLVHEGVRWFDDAVACSAEIRPRRRVAFLDVDDQGIRDLLAADPHLEAVVLRRTVRTGGEGYPEAPTPWQYLADGAESSRIRFVARAARLLVAVAARHGVPREAADFVTTLGTCERLVVRRERGRRPRRDALCDSVTLWAARMLGVAVELW